MIELPSTREGLNGWLFCLILLYCALAYGVHLVRRLMWPWNQIRPQHAKKLFDGVLFSGATMVAIGVLDNNVLALLGDTRVWLGIAAVAGLGYTVRALFPDSERR